MDSTTDCCSLVELRQYLLHPGARDTLADLFDEQFVESQERYGSHIVGQFRDLDRPDWYVWLRGFPDLRTRKEALGGFYGGPVWREHSAAANATMIDSGNALLLEPLDLGPAYPHPATERPPVGISRLPSSVVAGAVYHRRSPDDDFADFFAREVRPELEASGAELAAVFQSVAVSNNFPALPLRADPVFGWLAVFENDQAHSEHRAHLAASPTWRHQIAPQFDQLSAAPPQHLRLRPTPRSQLGAPPPTT